MQFFIFATGNPSKNNTSYQRLLELCKKNVDEILHPKNIVNNSIDFTVPGFHSKSKEIKNAFLVVDTNCKRYHLFPKILCINSAL